MYLAYGTGGVPPDLQQQVSTPAAETQWRFTYAVKCPEGAAQALLEEDEITLGNWFRALVQEGLTGREVVNHAPYLHTLGEWHQFSFDLNLPVSESVLIYFEAQAQVMHFHLDHVSLASIPDEDSCRELAMELALYRNDPAMLKHSYRRYRAAVNEAIREAPRSLWRMTQDISLTTAEDTRRYTMALITTLEDAHDLRLVEIEGADGHYQPVGRWWVEGPPGDLTLRLDETPTPDRTIMLHYVRRPDELDCEDEDDTTWLDREWLLAKAMTLLLLEADRQLEDPRHLSEQLQLWDGKRQAREAQEGRRWGPEKVRTRRWRA
jgi:hypothetical protein